MIYAKTYRRDNKIIPETLEEHTKALLLELKRLKALYGEELERIGFTERSWNLLRLACLLHDLGKVSSSFQEKIINFLEGRPSSIVSNKEIPHNYLSVAFLKNLKDLDCDSLLFLLYAIAFHHNRPKDFDGTYLKEVIAKDLNNKIMELKWLEKFGVHIDELWDGYYNYLDENVNTYKRIRKNKSYILLKGLLHRLDYSASAHLPVEERRIVDPERKLISYLSKKEYFSGLKPFQSDAKNLRDKNVLLTASTGMGKTEFAINWIGEDKAFYTLPLRVSVNAMYERFIKIFGDESVGLLHSDSLIYGLEKIDSEGEEITIEDYIQRVNATRQLSMPITITTADQLFTAVFKWKGYEKIYATLAYSKVIIDEPQSYSPEILACIIKTLQEIVTIGSKFCLMSATVHPFIKQYIDRYCEILDPVYNRERKHKIKLEDCSIEDLLPEIINAYKNGKKVLVITNTVKKAQELYSKLSGVEKKEINKVGLLHSGFIKLIRKDKEKSIETDYKKDEAVIWITTQIVEVSLDIDYDVLFTEIATADAIIQRMGRIYRRPNRVIEDGDEPNIIVATQNPSDKFYIYDEEIVKLTKDVLREFNYRVITEEQKQEVINQVFNPGKIKGTKFFQKFHQVYNLLDSGFETDDRGETQRIFRDIAGLTVIPETIYNKNLEMIDECITKLSSKDLSLEERLRCIKSLDDFTVGIPLYRVKGKEPIPIYKQRGIYLFRVNYDDELGILFNKNLEPFSNIV